MSSRRFYVVQLDKAKGIEVDAQGISRWAWVVIDRETRTKDGEPAIESWHDTRTEARDAAGRCNRMRGPR